MNKSEKSKGLTPSFSFTPKGTLRRKKYRKILFGTKYSNGFFAYLGGINDL